MDGRGGGGVAVRKVTIASNTGGLPFAKGETDAQGKLSFKVKPKVSYKLVETESLPSYGSAFGWESLPNGVTKTDDGLLVTAGATKSELKLTLTNEAHTTDLVFRLVNKSGQGSNCFH